MNKLVRKSVSAMKEYVPGKRSEHPDTVKLNANESPYLPSPGVQDILAMVDVSVLSRYPDPLCTELRKVIADLHGCTVDHVFVGNGSDEIMALCLRAFVERGEPIGYLDPSYSLYPVLADIEEVVRRPIKLDQSFGWSVPVEYKATLFFLTNPNAPTGAAASREQVAAFVQDFSGVVVIDEAYVDFADSNCMDMALEHEHVLVSRSLSKSYSLAGIRLGYCVGPLNLIGALHKIKDSYNVSHLTQEIARTALLDQDTMRANVQAVVETRKMVAGKMLEMGFEVSDSQTNFLWIKPLSITAPALFEALDRRRIAVRHFAGAPKTRDYLRVTIGTAPEMFRFLDAVEEILRGEE